MRFTTLSNYYLIDCDVMLIFFVYILVDLIQGFWYSYLTMEIGGLELALTIILVLQANQLTQYKARGLQLNLKRDNVTGVFLWILQYF